MPVETEPAVAGDKTDRISFSENTLTLIFGSFAALLGLVGIAGLFFGIVSLSGILPGFKPISVSAALAWIFFGFVLIIHARKPLTGTRLTVITAFLVVIALISALELPLNLLGGHFLAEDLVNSVATRIMAGQITYISPVATLLIILSAVALFLEVCSLGDSADSQRARDAAGILGSFIVIAGFTVLLSYVLGAPFLYNTTFIPIAFTSALAALFTGLGLITNAGSASKPLVYFTGSSVRARLLRVFLPLVVIIVIFQGLLQATFFLAYRIDNAIEVSIVIMLFCLVTAYVVGKAASEIGRLIESEEEKRKATEELLHESEETFRALADNANDGILVAVGPGVHVFANRRAAEITGYLVDELLRLTIKDLAHPDEYARTVRERYDKILAGEPVQAQYETIIVRKDGTNLPIEVTSAKTDWKGQAADLILIRDISLRKRAEEALRESEEKYRELFTRMIEGNALHEIVQDASGNPSEYRILDVNPAFEHIIGLKREEVIGKTSREAYSVATPPFLDIYARVAATGRPETFEVYFAPMKKYFSISAYPSGKGRFATIFEDITDQKLALEALRESEEKYREFFTTSRDCVFITSLEGKWIDFNDAGMEMFGYLNRDEFAKTSIKDFYYPPDSGKDLIKRIESEGFVKEAPVRMKRKDGRIIGALITAVPLRNPDGTFRAFIGTLRDVTEQTKAEERIRWLASFPELNPNPVIEMDAEGTITFANEVTFKTLRELGLPENPGLFVPKDKAEILRLLREGTESQLDREIVLNDETFNEHISLNHVLHVVRMYTFNITRQKHFMRERERLFADLEQKNTELERFTYTVSHDLRSPLITIHGFAGLLETDIANNDTAAISHDLERINTATTKMEELLHDLLNLSRIGRIADTPENVPFTLIAKEAVEQLEMPIRERKAKVVIDPDMPEVNVDRARVREAVMNLIENAVKFMGDRQHPEIRIGVESNDGKPVFFVRDNGIGIDPKYFGKLFNLFEKLDAKKEGSGIGLAIVKRIIEVQGGRIWVESDGPGKGSTFLFTLPAKNRETDTHKKENSGE